jgi:hypothetical protein
MASQNDGNQIAPDAIKTNSPLENAGHAGNDQWIISGVTSVRFQGGERHNRLGSVESS